MTTIAQRIERYKRLSGLELAYQYIYEHQIPLDQLDYNAKFLEQAMLVDLDKYNMNDMLREFQIMTQGIADQVMLPTSLLIPKGRKMFLRQWPRYMPEVIDYHVDAMEIQCLLNGETTPVINGTAIRMHPGDMCFIAPNTQHRLFVPEKDTVMFTILIYLDGLRDVLEQIQLGTGIFSDFLSGILYGRSYIPYLFCETGFDSLIFELLTDMLAVQTNEDPGVDNYLLTALEMVCLRLSRTHRHNITAGNVMLKNNIRITSLIHYAEAHYQTVSLEELSERFHYSPNYLSALIKKSYGRTFLDLLTEIRLRKAEEFLKTPNIAISAIPEMLGYSEKSYFYKLFRKYYHMTPAQYRAKNEAKTLTAL